MQFEATAIVLEGDLRGTYLGSIAWGWEKASGDAARPVLKPTTIEKISDGIPTAGFLRAARKWNEWNGGKRPSQHGRAALDAVKLPIPTLDGALLAQAPSVSKLGLLILELDAHESQGKSETTQANIGNLTFSVEWLKRYLKNNAAGPELELCYRRAVPAGLQGMPVDSFGLTRLCDNRALWHGCRVRWS